MATALPPSSYRCDCGEELDFFENTISDMEKMSKKKQIRLEEAGHTLLSYRSKAQEIVCPKLGNCAITDYE
jgi:hypothetical protein